MTPNISNETVREQTRTLTATYREIEEANGRHRAACRTAESLGCNAKAIMRTIRARRRDPAVVVSDLADTIRYHQLAGIDVSREVVFGDWDTAVGDVEEEEQRLFDAKEAGYAAGKAGRSLDDNPHNPGAETHVAWVHGHQAGAEAKAASMAPTGTAPAAQRRRSSRKPVADDKPRRGRGRPPGSKNKPKDNGGAFADV